MDEAGAEDGAEAEAEAEASPTLDLDPSGSLLRWSFRQRRAAMYRTFSTEPGCFAFTTCKDIPLGSLEPSPTLAPSKRSQAPTREDVSQEKQEDDTEESVAQSPVAAEVEEFLREAVEAGCEGLMCKHLDGPYSPSTTRNDAWVKLKKDYVGLG